MNNPTRTTTQVIPLGLWPSTAESNNSSNFQVCYPLAADKNKNSVYKLTF